MSSGCSEAQHYHTITAADTWIYFTHRMQPHQDHAHVRINLGPEAQAGAVYYLDDVELVSIPAPTPTPAPTLAPTPASQPVAFDMIYNNMICNSNRHFLGFCSVEVCADRVVADPECSDVFM